MLAGPAVCISIFVHIAAGGHTKCLPTAAVRAGNMSADKIPNKFPAGVLSVSNQMPIFMDVCFETESRLKTLISESYNWDKNN